MAMPTGLHDLVSAHRAREVVEPGSALRFPTGLHPLDYVLKGGVRPGDLALVLGRPGVGKTIMALQWARNVALQGHDAIYVCYEHNPETLLQRLIGLELGFLGHTDEDTKESLVPQALDRIGTYAGHLTFIQASGRSTDVDVIDGLAAEREGAPTAVFVDYLQKVRDQRPIDDEERRTAYIVEALKDTAVTRGVAMIAIAAADKESLQARRLRMHNVRGSSSLVYEPDVGLVLNEKASAVSKAHLSFDATRVEKFRQQLVVSIEKNRDGLANIDLEFSKDYGHYRLRPQGVFLAEKLVDEIIVPE
jgi:replicative DNA helicase